ncbi:MULTISPECIES: hypothetical protein [Paracoccaceae]|uniref:hypothetical protein n=1 Tax=Paracoccaceae TaxID=31989 RepID=UPI003299452C
MFDSQEQSDASQKQQRDFDDLNLEMSGQDVGRIQRFFGEGETRSPEAKRKKAEKEQAQQRLVDLLTNPIYKAKYNQAWSVLIAAETAVAKAYDQVDTEIINAKGVVTDMSDRAARLIDGSLVFRDENGDVRYADGAKVNAEDAASIVWTGNEPSFEEYSAATLRLSDLEASRRDVERYETDVLGDARDKLSDQDNAQSLGELDAMIKRIQISNPIALSLETESANSVSVALETTASITLPSIQIGN